jgi:hypothetical protein
MMKYNDTVTRLLWQAAGEPPGHGDAHGRCRICGEIDTGLSFADWVRPTFTDLDKLVAGDIICRPCQFAFDERSELLARRVGKDKPQRMRNYSHFIVSGEWLPLSKTDKAQMTDILLRQDWQAAIIAQSGQKHIIFRAQPRVVQFEELAILDISRLGEVLQIIEALYQAFSKSEIELGNYARHRIVKFGIEAWIELENQIKPWRGTALFGLALFLAQKKGVQNDGTSRDGSGSAGNNLAGHITGLQESLSDEHLEAVRGQHPVGGVHRQPGEVHQLALL